jgi:hypothetical protein
MRERSLSSIGTRLNSFFASECQIAQFTQLSVFWRRGPVSCDVIMQNLAGVSPLPPADFRSADFGRRSDRTTVKAPQIPCLSNHYWSNNLRWRGCSLSSSSSNSTSNEHKRPIGEEDEFEFEFEFEDEFEDEFEATPQSKVGPGLRRPPWGSGLRGGRRLPELKLP